MPNPKPVALRPGNFETFREVAVLVFGRAPGRADYYPVFAYSPICLTQNTMAPGFSKVEAKIVCSAYYYAMRGNRVDHQAACC